MTPDLQIRPATSADIPEILRQRRAMYEAMDYKDEDALSAMLSTCKPYLTAAIENRTFQCWLALENDTRRRRRSDSDQSLAQSSLRSGMPPSHDSQRLRRPDFRRKGVARRLMQTMIDWCREKNFAAVYLHASKDGKPLYETLGFEPTTEMRLKLRRSSTQQSALSSQPTTK